jgi:gliding motility-associated-like protein
MLNKTYLRLLIVYFLVLSLGARGTIWNVASNGNDQNSGSSSSPFLTIQKAVNTAQSSDTIQVSSGIFKGAKILNKDLFLTGIQGQTFLTGHDTSRVITIQNGKVVLENLILQNGYAIATLNGNRGALLYSEYDSIWVKNCVFRAGYAPQGGDYYAGGSHPTFINCSFQRNNSPLKTVHNDGSMFLVDNSNTAQFFNCFIDSYNHPYIFTSGFTHRIYNSTLVNVQDQWYVHAWNPWNEFLFINSILVEKPGAQPIIMPDLSNLWNGWQGSIVFDHSRIPDVPTNYSHNTGGSLTVSACDDLPVIFSDSSNGDFSLSLIDRHHNIGKLGIDFYTDSYGISRPDTNGLVDLGFLESNATWCDLTRARLQKGYLQIGCDQFLVWINGDSTLSVSWENQSSGDTTILLKSIDGYVHFTTQNGYGCVISDSIYIDVPTALDFTFQKVDVSCYLENDGAIVLTATGGAGNYSIDWSIGHSGANLQALGAGIFVFQIQDQNGCILTDSIQINQPDPLYIITDTLSVTCVNTSDGEISLVAFGGNGEYRYFIDGQLFNGIQSGLGVGTYQIRIEDKLDCDTAFAITFDPLFEPCVFVPNWFSPNGNGENEEWRIRGIEYENLIVSVFDINGTLIYKSNSTDYSPWDGTKSGTPMPTGDYYYIIESLGSFKTHSGYVTLFR